MTNKATVYVQILPTLKEDVKELTREQLDIELKKGYDSILEGKVYTADEVDAILKKEYGI